MLRRFRTVGEFVKFTHTLFALPFALSSMLVAAHGLPPARTIVLILMAMVTLRNAAMSFNRFADAGIDAKNPRTAGRHIPQGVFTRRFALAFALTNAILFIGIAALLNRPCFLLSFVAVFFSFFYSFTKRFTDLAHLFLGLVLGFAPVGAWIAVTGQIGTPPILLGLAVILWVAGFDVLYALQDIDFDRRERLHSLPARLGVRRALLVSRLFHCGTVVLLILFGMAAGLGWVYTLFCIVIAALLACEHSLVKPSDLSRINAAFFTVNGLVSLLFLAGVAIAAL